MYVMSSCDFKQSDRTTLLIYKLCRVTSHMKRIHNMQVYTTVEYIQHEIFSAHDKCLELHYNINILYSSMTISE